MSALSSDFVEFTCSLVAKIAQPGLDYMCNCLGLVSLKAGVLKTASRFKRVKRQIQDYANLIVFR